MGQDLPSKDFSLRASGFPFFDHGLNLGRPRNANEPLDSCAGIKEIDIGYPKTLKKYIFSIILH